MGQASDNPMQFGESTNCIMTCVGNTAETCGGGGANSLHSLNFPPAPPPTLPTLPLTPSPPSLPPHFSSPPPPILPPLPPSLPPHPPSFTYLGCFGDGWPIRSLPTLLQSSAQPPELMTTELCADMAAAQGYSFFGTQAGIGEPNFSILE